MMMDSIVSESVSNVTNASANANAEGVVSDESPKVKFLCSFGGSILPRPQDGRLRYVGGETRIVSVAREIGFEELMGKMRELYEGAAILKYQQPDEDLDALVSVVNDDDVTNMMEEYDKLGSVGDGFTRLRIFLFSYPEQDVSPHYMDGIADERDTERRYVDALNSLSESPELRRLSDSPVMTPVDEVHLADQFYNSMNLEGSGHNQRNFEMALPQYNLRQLAVPSLGSGQHSGSGVPRYSEDAPWSPAYYSPRCGVPPHDGRGFSEYPSSPSSVRYHVPLQEVPDKSMMDRFPEESCHLRTNNQIPFDHQQQYSDNVVWVPTGGVPVDRGGFPGNILSGPGVGDGANVCGNCKVNYQRNPSSEFHWRPEDQAQLEQPALVNGMGQVPNRCVECFPGRESALLNVDSKLQPGMYREQGDPRTLYNEPQTSDRGRVLQNQLRTDDPRAHISVAARMGDHYSLGGTAANTPLGPSNMPDGNLVPPNYARHEDPRYVRPGAELGGEVFRDQSMVAGSHVHVPFEERGMRSSNVPYSYGAEVPHQVLHNNPSAQAVWRNAAPPMQVHPLYDSSSLQPRNSMPTTVVSRSTAEGRPGFGAGGDQSPWVDTSQKKFGVDGSAVPEYAYGHVQNISSANPYQEVQPIYAQDPVRNLPNTLNVSPSPLESQRSSELPSTLRNDNMLPNGAQFCTPVQGESTGGTVHMLDGRSGHGDARERTSLREAERSGVNCLPPATENCQANNISTVASPGVINSNGMKPDESVESSIQSELANAFLRAEKEDLSFLPEFIASAKRAKLESAEVVKARAQEESNAATVQDKTTKLANVDEPDSPDVDGHSEAGSDNENCDISKIESSTAEEEAVAKGLQFIKNADVEEIRELGSGTYGAVYHGKWKGSDVAIKRIKASCFAGRPSERERLIADFWKEALILSSLHHPNVVSFYGIVRDGPDGSLATVTEFMVNGSLKQYLQKKDRTIDRRKRLIIAMDAAFGMEYLHGKNIVHFDLKCENLLVNMRDPHRPVCKIGDLGLSKVKQHTLVSGGVRGTLPWMAPELLSGKSNMVTEKIDVYSFAIVMWELLSGEEPYKDMHCASIIGGIVNNTLRPQIPTWCDPEWKSLMESCWASDPEQRPSFSEISQKLRNMAAAINVK